jgi:hypothetical protein
LDFAGATSFCDTAKPVITMCRSQRDSGRTTGMVKRLAVNNVQSSALMTGFEWSLPAGHRSLSTDAQFRTNIGSFHRTFHRTSAP